MRGMARNTTYSSIGHGRILDRDLHPSFWVNIDGMMGGGGRVAAFADDKGGYLLFIGNYVSDYLRLIIRIFGPVRGLGFNITVAFKGEKDLNRPDGGEIYQILVAFTEEIAL